jgi:hypothetical protein
MSYQLTATNFVIRLKNNACIAAGKTKSLITPGPAKATINSTEEA